MTRLRPRRIGAIPGAVALLLILPGTGAFAAAKQETFTLTSAVETALLRNIDMRQGKNQIQAKDIEVRQQKALFHPDLNLSGQVSRQTGRAPTGESDEYDTQNVTRTSIGLTSRLNLFNGFHDTSALRQAKTELAATRRDVSRLREEIIYQTVNLYVAVVSAEELVRVEEENLAAQREQLKLIAAFQEAGRRPLADLYLQQAETARAEYRLLNARRNVRVNTHLLLEFMGLDPGTPCRFSGLKTPDPDPGKTPNPDSDRRVAEALARRPDLLAQSERLEAARLGIRSARSGFWPSLDLTLSTGTSTSSLVADIYPYSQQAWENNPYASLGLTLALPLADRATTRTQVARARLNLENERLAAERLELQIATEVRQAVEDHRTSREEVAVTETQLKYSRQSLDSTEARYRANAATLAELSLARSQLLQAHYDGIIARHALFLRRAALAYVGGDVASMMTVISAADPHFDTAVDSRKPE